MSLTINAAQIADTGFVLFVVFTCGYSLFGNKEQGSGKSKKWIQELSNLQEALMELIGEASSASSHLDRTLQKRKLELEKLLSKLSSASNSYATDLPNDSWEERSPVRRQPPIERETRAMAPRPQPQPAPQSNPQTQKPKAPVRREIDQRDSELARRIEVFLDDKKAPRLMGKVDESSDPAAYKIARRLLEAGKEIHLVAKKVGLPIEEIRVLDSMVNGPTEIPEEVHFVRAIEPVASAPVNIAPRSVAPVTGISATYSRSKQIIRSQEEFVEDTEDENAYDEEIFEEPKQMRTAQIRRATTLL